MTLYCMVQDLQNTRKQIFDELTKIVDPEIGVSIMELELVDNVNIDSGSVSIDLHLTSPFCPAVFGFKIAQDVRDNVYRIPEISSVKVNVSNHFMSEALGGETRRSHTYCLEEFFTPTVRILSIDIVFTSPRYLSFLGRPKS